MHLFTQRLKHIRETKRLTQKEVAERLGIDYKKYNHYETGRNEPDLAMTVAIATFFNIPLDYLLGRTNDPSPLQKEKTVSQYEDILRDLDGITPEMALEVRQYIGYLKHKNEAANALGKKT